ncbi:Glutathione S-transferase, omega [hydrothermal vent metagenome]|uniref:Glutathione S-transferase, omega n=1 Tax=hydrothermal vent metagenome TaxID=652676 RepID=A0A3B1ALS2_9ZZZZ
MKNNEQGEFVRWQSSFRNWITSDGSAGPSGTGDFKAQANRYHLYVSLACPWAHRSLIFRELKGLNHIITVSVVHPLMPDISWIFGDYPGATTDEVNGKNTLAEVYKIAKFDFNGVVTVPVLWDKKRNTIVNNESSEIIRMLNSAFNDLDDNKINSNLDFYPTALRDDINAVNTQVYDNINNGVYRTGFASSQTAYEQAYYDLFNSLEAMEQRLASQKFLVGDVITEADWRFFVTLVRFDAVYVGHFKCNKKRIVDFPNLWQYTKQLYQIPGVAATVNLDHIKYHYYASHYSINPTRIVPVGPELNFMAKHNR